jgi:hypothetical protein
VVKSWPFWPSPFRRPLVARSDRVPPHPEQVSGAVCIYEYVFAYGAGRSGNGGAPARSAYLGVCDGWPYVASVFVILTVASVMIVSDGAAGSDERSPA